MRTKLGLRQAVISTLIFGGVLLALVSIDPRVRERMTDVLASGDGLAPWSARAADLGYAVTETVRHQSIENAPLVIFATVGAILFVFMLRT